MFLEFCLRTLFCNNGRERVNLVIDAIERLGDAGKTPREAIPAGYADRAGVSFP
jgi:hypothetical protein